MIAFGEFEVTALTEIARTFAPHYRNVIIIYSKGMKAHLGIFPLAPPSSPPSPSSPAPSSHRPPLEGLPMFHIDPAANLLVTR